MRSCPVRNRSTVLQAVENAVAQYRLPHCVPQKIMTNFEKGIIDTTHEVFPEIQVACCFFHLGQLVYRQLQDKGLQEAYNDPDDCSVKTFIHKHLALTYVSIARVQATFELLVQDAPNSIVSILDYFKETYVAGHAARGRRRAVPLRYPPSLWNQYDAVLANRHKTNNASEGFHNRFRVIVAKHHPDLYSALTEILKERTNTEISLAELALGRKVKNSPKRKWVQLQTRICSIVFDYNTYVDNDEEMVYLTTLAHTIVVA